jgi:hypothetical protein
MRHRFRYPPLFRTAPLLVVLWVAGPMHLLAQTGEIQGRVLDETRQSPLAGAAVTLVGSDVGTVTRADGGFLLQDLAPGVYTVEVRFLGFQTTRESDVAVQPSHPTFVLVELKEEAVAVEGIVVEGGDAFSVPDDSPVSLRILAAEEVRRTPGGFSDISRTLLSLPGVVGGVDNRNDLLVRGGAPSENAYYLDGIRIPQINHFATQGASGGALGLVNVDFIRETEFYTGGYPVRYGDALSSVLLLENRPGSPGGVQGDFTVGASEAALTLDGPLTSKGNWLFSARRSYTQFLFELLDLPIRPDYWDFQTRVEYDVTPRDRLMLVGIGAIDDFDIVDPGPDGDPGNIEIYNRVIDNDQRSYTLGTSWRRLFGDGYFTLSLSRSVSDFRFADRDQSDAPLLRNRSVEVDNRLRLDGDLRVSRTLSAGWGAGGSYSGIDTEFLRRATPGSSFDQDLAFAAELRFWKSYAYGQLTWRGFSGRLTATGGLRVDEVSFLRDGLSVSPRLSASLQLGDRWTASVSAGVFHQTPQYISMAVQEDGRYVNRRLRPIRNDQWVAGLSWRANPGLQLKAEGFYKRYSHYPVSRDDPRISLANLGGDYGFVGAEPLTPSGKGRARGIELFAQQKLTERIYFLGAYTLSWSEFTGSDGVYKPSTWDRRHALDLTSGYRLGDLWEFGAKWRLLSGRADTQFDPVLSPIEFQITGRGVPDWDRIGTERTPVYSRLDVRVERRFFFDRWNARVYLDIQNVLNQPNPVGYRYTEDPAFPDHRRPIDGAGVLPTIGFTIEW